MNRRRFLIHSCSALAAAPWLLRAQPTFGNTAQAKSTKPAFS